MIKILKVLLLITLHIKTALYEVSPVQLALMQRSYKQQICSIAANNTISVKSDTNKLSLADQQLLQPNLIQGEPLLNTRHINRFFSENFKIFIKAIFTAIMNPFKFLIQER